MKRILNGRLQSCSEVFFRKHLTLRQKLFETWAGRRMLRVTRAYARDDMIEHYAYAPVLKSQPRVARRY